MVGIIRINSRKPSSKMSVSNSIAEPSKAEVVEKKWPGLLVTLPQINDSKSGHDS